PALQREKSRFFERILGCNVAFGMKRTRHQLAPAMPGEEIVNRAIAGRMADRLLMGVLEIVNVQQFARPGRIGKARQQRLLLGNRHVLTLSSAARLRLESFDAALVISHVRAIDRAQRTPHRRRNWRLRQALLAQQHHPEALALLFRDVLPTQRLFEPPNLAFVAFDHWAPRIRGAQPITLQPARFGTKLPQTTRFNPFRKRYYLPIRAEFVVFTAVRGHVIVNAGAERVRWRQLASSLNTSSFGTFLPVDGVLSLTDAISLTMLEASHAPYAGYRRACLSFADSGGCG